MNTLTLLFGVLLCIVFVNARHYGDRRDDESIENEEETLRRPRDPLANRHRRRRWQANYGYDYTQPMYNYPDRREYDRNQEVLNNIYRLLEEISVNVRRQPPPPPPVPVYIPYPVYFPQMPQVTCNTPKVEKKPNVTNRVSDMEDTNQNWGLVVSGESDYDDGSDGARPISFDPIIPKQHMKRPTPQVEHGSVQAAHTTQAPKFEDSEPSALGSAPGMCNAAILSCCGYSNNKLQQKQCFANVGCSMTYDDNVCSAASIQRALDSFKTKYSPVN